MPPTTFYLILYTFFVTLTNNVMEIFTVQLPFETINTATRFTTGIRLSPFRRKGYYFPFRAFGKLPGCH
jgi:hypothetical protein